MDGLVTFQLNIAPSNVKGCVANLDFESVDMENILETYQDFSNVFSKAKADTLAPHWPYDLKIVLEDSTMPPQPPIYSLSNSKLGTLWEFIDEHLNISFIWPSHSSHGAPILFVKKKDGSLWLCMDFWGLNKVMKKDHYLLPLITDLLDVPWKAQIYTKIDLQHAYHLVQITKGDKWKTAFQTHYSSFEWLVMPFGLTNRPAAFQQFMNNIFGDLLDQCMVVYLDNILIYSNNPKQHTKHIWEVLQWLQKHSLYAKAKKCEWHCNSVEFLGYIMSSEGLTMADNKICTILDWPKPQKVKDI